MRILVVEDDLIISDNIKTFLSKKGFSVDIATTIKDGYKKTIDADYDMVLLDRGLPDGDGLSLISRVRMENANLPVLVLTAKNQDKDVVDGLNTGADDYLSKPFDMNVLTARIKALARRRNRTLTKPILIIKDLILDSNSTIVKKNNLTINLTPKEFALLEYLMINKNRTIDRLTLLNHVWDENADMFSNTVDVHIKYLRNKLGDKVIKTIRGVGYTIIDK